MKKWNGKKRIGRKARAKRAEYWTRRVGLAPLPAGLYTFQIDAAKMLQNGNLKFNMRINNGDTQHRTSMTLKALPDE